MVSTQAYNQFDLIDKFNTAFTNNSNDDVYNIESEGDTYPGGVAKLGTKPVIIDFSEHFRYAGAARGPTRDLLDDLQAVVEHPDSWMNRREDGGMRGGWS